MPRLHRFLTALALTLTFYCLCGGSAQAISIGVAKQDVTPRGPVLLAGYGGRTGEHEGIDTHLWARALVIGKTKPLVIVAVDNCGMPASFKGRLAKQLKKLGIDANRLVIAATHTHNAPTLTGYAPVVWAGRATKEQQENVQQYTEFLISKMESAVEAALQRRQSMQLNFARGRATFGGNRRVLNNGKWSGFGFQRSGPVDHSLPVLAARDEQGKVRAVWANYACHCTTVGARNRVGGDWAGFANQWIEKEFPDAISLVTIGCGADVGPQPSGSLQLAELHGRSVAHEVARLLASELRPITEPPQVESRTLQLPLATAPNLAFWKEQVSRGGFYEQQARLVLDKLGDKKVGSNKVPYPITVWKFADQLAIIFLAGEVVVDYAVRLNKELNWQKTWITAWANDMPGYIPSRRILQEGGYESEFSQVYYAQPGPYSARIEDTIVHAVKALAGPNFTADPNQPPAPFHRQPSRETETLKKLTQWAEGKKPAAEQKLLQHVRELVEKAKPGVEEITRNDGQTNDWFNFAGDHTRRAFIRQSAEGKELHWRTMPLAKDAADNVTYCFTGGMGWTTEPKTKGFELLVNGKSALQFDVTLKPSQWKSSDGKVELTYFPTWKSDVDSAGFFFVRITKPELDDKRRLKLAARSLSKASKRWFAVDQKQEVKARLLSLKNAIYDVADTLTKQSKLLNKRCPIKVDAVTTLEKTVAGPGKQLTYVYSVGVPLNAAQKGQLTKAVRRKALATKALQPFFDRGVTLIYRYNDKQGKLMHEFSVKPIDPNAKDL